MQMFGRRHIDDPVTTTISDLELGVAVVLLFVILALSAIIIPALG
jgi:hypothetical protein